MSPFPLTQLPETSPSPSTAYRATAYSSPLLLLRPSRASLRLPAPSARMSSSLARTSGRPWARFRASSRLTASRRAPRIGPIRVLLLHFPPVQPLAPPLLLLAGPE